MPEDKALVFVLMPFDDEFDSVYQALIKEPLESLNVHVRRADSLLNQQSILRDIVRGIAEASLIIADVSGLNSNVLYELGLAHALGKRVVMITRSIDELPFDLRVYKANEYSTHFRSAEKLKQLLVAVCEATLDNTVDFSNPVQDFAPEMLLRETDLPDVSRKPTTSLVLHEPDEVHETASDAEQEPGTLERRVTLERLGTLLVKHAGEISKLTEEIGSTFDDSTERLQLVTARLGDRAAGAQLAVSRDTAKAIFLFVDKVKPESIALREVLSDLVTNTDALSREISIESDEDAEIVMQTLNDFVDFETSLAQANQGISEFAETMVGVPNVDSELTKASKRAGRLLKGTGDTLLNALAEVARTRGFLEERVAAYVRSGSEEAD